MPNTELTMHNAVNQSVRQKKKIFYDLSKIKRELILQGYSPYNNINKFAQAPSIVFIF